MGTDDCCEHESMVRTYANILSRHNECDPDLRTRCGELYDALKKYGRHLPGCRATRTMIKRVSWETYDCTCGLRDALERP